MSDPQKSNRTQTPSPRLYGIITKNWSENEFRINKATYKWEIKHFRSIHGDAEVGESLDSPVFTSGNKCKWSLILYPKGKSQGFVSLDIKLHSSSELTSVFFCDTMYIMDSEQRKRNLKQDNIVNQVTSWRTPGYDEFIELETLLANNILLPSGNLTICCEITYFAINGRVVRDIYDQFNSTLIHPDAPVHSLSKDFGVLLDKQELTDVVLSVSSKNFPAHKNILAARSPVFAAMFRYNMMENQNNRVDISDIDENVMGEMLRYIYSGKVKNLDELANGLLMAADKYGLEELKVICEDNLFKNLSIENAAHMLMMANLRHSSRFKSEVMDFIVSKPNEVMNTTAWKNSVVPDNQLLNEVCMALSRRVATFSSDR